MAYVVAVVNAEIVYRRLPPIEVYYPSHPHDAA
jgi:hypothetical protein